jgi:transcriptional regulator with GAF, ATPase, and Fis domain
MEFVDVPGAMAESVEAHLRSVDVALRPRDFGPEPVQHGVVVFAASTACVMNLIRRITECGSRRVLALCTAPVVASHEGWELMRAGASDVVAWRDPGEAAAHTAGRLRRWQAIDDLVACEHVRKYLVGDSRTWQAVLRDAVEVARFTNASVLLTGESGTGKERVAQLIHQLDPRPNKGKLVVLDCSTVVPSLSGSEFFGHEKGAFTGASTAREGAFELANGGTLFLDEVGELTVALQAELLRVIQEGTFKRVGSNLWRTSAFRLICATNRDLSRERVNGTFRNDFYYRIADYTLHLPSLRDRIDDVIPLFRHFFREVHPDREAPGIEASVRELLATRAYPGNVRDLRSLVLRIAHRHLGDQLVTVGDIPERERPAAEPPGDATDAFEHGVRRRLEQGATLDDITSAVAEAAVRVVLADEGGCVHRVARRLGVPVSAIERWSQHSQATPR